LLLVAAAVPASAQGGPPPGMGRPEGVRGDPKRAEMDAQTRREAMLRTAGRPGSAAEVNPLQLAAAIEQTKNDFKRIQLLRNDIVASLLAKKPLDYRQLASEAE
jgi:hypothetical protein